MYPQLIIIEDEADLLSFYRQEFEEVGFADVVCIDNTERVVERIVQSYTKPTLLLCDYYVHPIPPSRYLPELRNAGVEIPAVLVSGRIRADQINGISLIYPVHGFFEKAPNVKLLVNSIAKHLIDMGPEAAHAWEKYQLRREVNSFIGGMTAEQCSALLCLLAMEDVKAITADVNIGLNAVYALRKDMIKFLGKVSSPPRYTALVSGLRDRISLSVTLR